jgi:exodeoxyribonuclease VII large subunit
MTEPQILTVSELTRQVKDLVEANFPTAWVQGEISNCTRAASGHLYFTLKDEAAQIRAVMWRSQAARVKFELEDGMEVVASGPIEVYQARGTYQIIVERMIPQGVGALELAFRQMRDKLAAEGLFEAERKRPLPAFPRRIALVTSPTSAAVRDLLQVMTRRWPTVDVVVLPVAVQGEGAAGQIAVALDMVHQIPGVDVVIAGRGGGSLEDLWAFNEEIVARAIFNCRIPVVSAVGHEIDVSISDLVADRRALTPSEAAELVVPQRDEVLSGLARMADRMRGGIRDHARRARLELEALAARRVFTRPRERIHQLATQVDELDARLRRAAAVQQERLHQRLSALADSLQALSPLNVLKRGYSITRQADDDEVIRTAEQLSPGARITTLFEKGRVVSVVESVDEGDTFARPVEASFPSSKRTT